MMAVVDVLQDLPVRDGDRTLKADFRGDGAVLGVVLSRSDVEPDPFTGLTQSLLVMRAGGPGETESVWTLLNAGEVLPRGRYRAYLISDRTGQVTLRFPAEAGTAAIFLDEPAVSIAEELPQRTLPNGTVIFGASHEVRGSGLIWMQVEPYHDAGSMAADESESCFYADGSADGAGDAAYSPGCPGGELSRRSRTHPEQRGYAAEHWGSFDGQQGIGGNVSRVGAVSPVAAAAAWVQFPAQRLGSPAGAPPAHPPLTTTPQQSDVVPVSRRLGVSGRRARLRLRCTGRERCRGSARITVSRRSSTFSIPAGARRAVHLHVSRRACRRLRRRGKLVTTLVLTTRSGSASVERRGRVTLVRRRAGRRSS